MCCHSCVKFTGVACMLLPAPVLQYLDGPEVDVDLVFDQGVPVYGAVTVGGGGGGVGGATGHSRRVPCLHEKLPCSYDCSSASQVALLTVEDAALQHNCNCSKLPWDLGTQSV
jgi:hypothetical protein